MAVSFQQQARRRKLTYFGLIVLLLSLQVPHRLLVIDQADKHDLSDVNIGAVDLGGSAARFALTSFRGPLICAMWWEAIERQKRMEYHQCELLARALTKLQPHFKKPWSWWAWNIAYNVSVEFDRVQDKYFYIAEGSKWLAEGERINRSRVWDEATKHRYVVGDPELRHELGFFFMDKMNVSDEANYFRCMLPLSCIDPAVWDPSETLSLSKDPAKLQLFKRQFPQWTRRLRDLRHVPEGSEAVLDQEILAYLGQQREAYLQGRFPSLYQYDPHERHNLDSDQPFPVWPNPEPEEALNNDQRLTIAKPANPQKEENQSSYEIARIWYDYSTVPMPPPAERPFYMTTADKKFYRMPHNMVSLIFRKYPAQAKSSEAEALARDGWLDRTDMETGNSQDTWKKAFGYWYAFGHDNALEFEPAKQAELEKQARWLVQKFPDFLKTGSLASYERSQEGVEEAYKAFSVLTTMRSMRQMANYDHWMEMTKANCTDEAVKAHRYFYNAHRRGTDLQYAHNQYQLGMAAWEGLLTTPRKLDPERDLLFLLSAGPWAPLRPTFVFQPIRLFDLTPLGKDHQTLELLIESMDGYLRVQAKIDAPKWLATSISLVEGARSLGLRLAGPGGPSWPVAALPSGLEPLTLDGLEYWLEGRITPLDYLMPQDLAHARGLRGERTIQRSPWNPDAASGGPPQGQPPSSAPPGGQPPRGR